jgi:hypothetical protein
MTARIALHWMEFLIGWAVMLQTVELLCVREVFQADGVWQWEILQSELPHLGWIFRPTPFTLLLALRFLGALLLPLSPDPILPIFLALSSVVVCLRWRGTYNGGSDYMTLLILFALSAARLGASHPHVVAISLGYVAVQSTLSYFIAGVVKLRNPSWRKGRALAQLLNSPLYALPPRARGLSGQRLFCFLGAWAVLLFECGFPLVFVDRKFCFFFLALAGGFHLINVYTLGLNRFFWAWIASFPAIIFLASH